MFDYAGVGQYQKAFGNPHLNHGMYGHAWFQILTKNSLIPSHTPMKKLLMPSQISDQDVPIFSR